MVNGQLTDSEPRGPKAKLADELRFRKIRFWQWWHGRREAIATWLVTRILKWAVPDDSLEHALRELGPRPPDRDDDGSPGNPDQWMHDHLTLMVRLFSLEGHSGFSASIAISWLHRLLAHKPLGPLTGEDDEWMTGHMLENSAQNLRRGSVFRGPDGVAYDIDGFVFREPPDPDSDSGYRSTFTSYVSRKVVRFPYGVPDEPIIVDVRWSPHKSNRSPRSSRRACREKTFTVCAMMGYPRR